MSDELHKYCNFEKFKRDIVVDTNHSLRYVRKQCVNSEEVVFTVHITNDVLKRWHDFKNTQSLNGIKTFSFVELLNLFLAQNHAIVIKKNCSRIEERLRRYTSATKAKSCGKRGGAFVKFCKQSKSIAIHNNEVLTAAELEKALCDLKATKDALEAENDILQQRCSDLYQSLLQAQEERSKSCEELTKVQADLDRVKRENVHLWQYMDNLSEQEGFKNCGKPISEVKGRQQRRKVRELKTYVEKALWFAETFGLKLSSVEFACKDGKSHTIDYQVDLDRKKSYTELSEEEQIKVQQVLFITDKFCIGEAAYHELTMTDGGTGLPRSYLLKQCKTQLNSLCHIRRTPGEDEGAQLDLLPELKNTIAKQVISMYFLDTS